MTRRRSSLSASWVGILLFASSAFSQETQVSWSAFTAGYGVLAGENTGAQGVAGQCFVGDLEGPNTAVGGGFLYNPDITGSTFSLAISIQEGWNLVSLPVSRDSSEDSVRDAFPNATYEHGFAYLPGIGYEQRFRLTNSVGYWIKFPAPELASILGGVRALDTLHVDAGWNLIGSISSMIDTATIISDPPYNRISPWFGYFGALIPVDVITPGYAYWVKAEGAGVFILSAGLTLTPNRPGVSPLSALNSLRIADARGRAQTLYFGDRENAQLHPDFFELPPAGPEGTFDVRFESQRMVEIVTGETPVSLRSCEYPVSIVWNVNTGSTFTLAGLDGSPQALTGKGELQITNRQISRITLSPTSASYPTAFRLDQNHPNPFNPVSTITFALPGGSSQGEKRYPVSLQVFDLLGRSVATLVNEELEPGIHSASFDATGLASGVYLYRLEAGTFVQTRKMMLLR
jgi:hypothetical protein